MRHRTLNSGNTGPRMLKQPSELSPIAAESDPLPLLRVGETCWSVCRANRLAFLIDGAQYFAAVKAAMENAKESIFIIAWDFDRRTRLSPDAKGPDKDLSIGAFLHRLVTERPRLRVNILKWRMPFAIAIQQPKLPLNLLNLFSPQRVQYRVDGGLPAGACHHQKIVVIDDALAFCGGSDFCPNRWDTPAHPDEDARRRLPNGRISPPRHEAMIAVDGEAARSLALLARERWQNATGIATPIAASAVDPWPEWLAPDLTDIDLGVSRTMPPRDGRPEIREIEAMTFEAVARAETSIYCETQYFASSILAPALARRLQEPHGPEIVIVCPGRSPSYFDHLAMDPIRNGLLRELRAADRFGRFRIYAPVTAQGAPVIVHSKVMIVDDRILRIGSSNVNNRSMGFDSECDVTLDAARAQDPRAAAEGVRALRTRLLAEHLAVPQADVARLCHARGLIGAIEALNRTEGRRLVPVEEMHVSPFDGIVRAGHLWDPVDAADAWRPWRGRRTPAHAPKAPLLSRADTPAA